MGSYRIISSDNHVTEPPDLWTSRIAPKFKDRAPHVIRMQDGGDWWVCEDLRLVSYASGSQTGVRFENQDKLTSARPFEDARAGGYIPEEHVKDMDLDGVDVSIVYPTAGALSYSIRDSELLTAIFSAYNDWVAEFCRPFPRRIKGIGVLNVDDVQVGVKEMERCAKMGLVGAITTVYPPGDKPYHSPEYEPLWAADQDLGIPLSLHIGTNRPGPGQEFADQASLTATFLTNVDYWVRTSLGHIIFSGVFERYPKLQVGSVEQELSWVPHFLERMDYTYTQRTFRDNWYRYKEDMIPS